MVLKYDACQSVLDFLSSEEGRTLSAIGPATPDHLIHTKRRPLWIEPVDLSNVVGLKASINDAMTQ